jgi:hypothetical protein
MVLTTPCSGLDRWQTPLQAFAVGGATGAWLHESQRRRGGEECDEEETHRDVRCAVDGDVLWTVEKHNGEKVYE